MPTRMIFTLISALSVFFSSSVIAHISQPGEGLIRIILHPFTGLDHLLTLILVGVGIVSARFLYRRFR